MLNGTVSSEHQIRDNLHVMDSEDSMDSEDIALKELASELSTCILRAFPEPHFITWFQEEEPSRIEHA